MSVPFAKLQGMAVVGAAMAVANRAKMFALLSLAGAAALLLAGIPAAMKKLPADADAAYRAGYIGGAVSPVIAFTVLGVLLWLRGRRAARVAKLAHAQPTSAWVLRGNTITCPADPTHTLALRARDASRLATAAAASGR